MGGIYDFRKLDSIRHISYAYFHGHCVGGTNPSLLEAMASECFIFSHDNVFNRSVLRDHAIYYQSTEDVTKLLNEADDIVMKNKEDFTSKKLDVIRNHYSWDKLIDEQEKYFQGLMDERRFAK